MVNEVASQRALARILGITQQMVNKLTKASDWPVERRLAPWSAEDAQKVKAWYVARQTPAEGSTKAKIDEEKLAELQLKNAERRGRLVDRSLLDDAIRSNMRDVVREIEQVEQALPLQLVGLDPGRSEKVITGMFNEMRKRLASAVVVEIQRIEEATKPKPKKRRK